MKKIIYQVVEKDTENVILENENIKALICELKQSVVEYETGERLDDPFLYDELIFIRDCSLVELLRKYNLEVRS